MTKQHKTTTKRCKYKILPLCRKENLWGVLSCLKSVHDFSGAYYQTNQLLISCQKTIGTQRTWGPWESRAFGAISHLAGLVIKPCQIITSSGLQTHSYGMRLLSFGKRSQHVHTYTRPALSKKLHHTVPETLCEMKPRSTLESVKPPHWSHSIERI